MTDRKLRDTLQLYCRELHVRGHAPIENVGDLPDENRRLNHCYWCCHQALAFIGDQTDKAHRWLGYVQGVLHALHIFSLDELRAHSRGEPEGPR